MENATLIQKHWLLQPRHKHLFAVSAAVTATILGFVVIASLITQYGGKPFTPEGVLSAIVGTFVGVTGAIAAMYLWVGMGWYWLRLDHSSSRTKKLWFLVLVVFNWVGAIVYYFIVYRRAASSGDLR